MLTPEEFVAAGDFLVSTCPTWSWDGGDTTKRRAYLPADKQFLVTRNVPCRCRAADLLSGDLEEELVGGTEGGSGDDAWLATGGRGGVDAAPEDDAVDMSLAADVEEKLAVRDASDDAAANDACVADPGGGDDDGDDDSDVPDMEDFVVEEEDDTVTIHPRATAGGAAGDAASDPASDAILKTRTYDLSVTYDKYYQTPRFWLVGYDEARALLKPELALDDISADHAAKTVTIDPHPHLPLQAASIHPCKHAHVMKRLLDNLCEAKGSDPHVEFYLILFLKFIASIVPTIDYDYTMAADVGAKPT